MTRRDRSELRNMTSEEVVEFTNEYSLPSTDVWNLSRDVPCAVPAYIMERIHDALAARRSQATKR